MIVLAVIWAAAGMSTITPSAAAETPTLTSMTPSSGPHYGGTAVVLTGTGFGAATGVRFGGDSAESFRIDSDTQITAVSPAHPTAANLDVTVLSPSSSSTVVPEGRYTYTEGAWARSGSDIDGPVQRIRGHRAVVLSDGRVLVVGGRTTEKGEEQPSATAEIFHPGTRTWSPTGSMATARTDFTATLLPGGKVLVAGGTKALTSTTGPLSEPTALESAELFDAAQGRWSASTPMPRRRTGHTATLLENGEVLVAGGNGDEPAPLQPQGKLVPSVPGAVNPVALDSALLFDSSADAGRGSWRDAGNMSKARSGHTAVVLADGAVLVADAADDPPLPSDIFVPGAKGAAGAWRQTVPMLGQRGHFQATLLADGRVLASGGSTGLAATEVFDPKGNGGQGTWSGAAPLLTPREQSSATLLTHDCGAYCGMVLVAGGITQGPINSEHATSTEVFDPADGSWSPGPPMPDARGTHVAVDLLDGTVLLVGGGGSPAAAELFDRRAPRPALAVTGLNPGSGSTRGGTTISVTGAGFFDRASVRVGDQPAPVTFLSDTLLTVTAPPSVQGEVEVSVNTTEATSERSDKSAFIYETSTWTPTTSSIQRYAHEAVLLDPASCRAPVPPSDYPCGKVLIAAGTTNFGADGHSVETLNSALLYDPTSRSSTPTVPMSGARFDFTASLLDGTRCAQGPTLLPPVYPCGQVLVAGGRLKEGAVNTAELFDPVTGRWTPTKNRLADARLSHTATLLDGPACRRSSAPAYCDTVLVAGGATTENKRPPQASAELYNPVTGVWQATGAMRVARTNHTATLLDGPACHQDGPPGYCGKVLVAGGLGPAGGLGTATCERRPPSPSCPADTVLASAELYDPATGLWSPTADLSVGRLGQTATELGVAPCGANCGKVLVAGGAHGYPYVPVESSEIYDPATGTWSPTTSTLHAARVGHTATELPDGTVMVAGGAMPFDDTRLPSLASAEIFDPITGRWGRTLAFSGPRGLHSATLLGGPACRSGTPSDAARWCGTVLLAGGYSWTEDNHNEHTVLVEPDQSYAPTLKVTGISPAGGPSAGGGSLTISGSRFYDVERVLIGGVSASFTVRFPTEISAVIPARRSGAAEVVVETAEGTSAALKPRPSTLYQYGVSQLPGRVEKLVATAVSDSAVDLSWAAPASDGEFPPPASTYVVKQSLTPIADEGAFDAATTLCGTRCEFVPRAVGEELHLAVGNLVPATTYHYAVRAVNDIGAGPVSEGVSVTTASSPVPAPACSVAPTPATGQVSMAGGQYSLVGFPGGTTLGEGATLYGWFDQGAGTDYTSQAGADPLVSGRGYWAWSPCSRLVDLAESATSASMPLAAYHASMVGNPSANGPAQVAGHDFAATWDPASESYRLSAYRQPQSLDVGQGGWVFSFVPTRITIEPGQ